jgi:predicted RNase H-like nuclease
VLAAATHAEAVRLGKQHAGFGISIQMWNIVAKVTEVDAWIGPERQRTVVEVHPELSFRALDPHVDAPKKTARGTGQRLRALGAWVDLDLAEAPAGVPVDDALDAVAAAWSAARWRDGVAEVLGGDRDARGLRMEMAV